MINSVQPSIEFPQPPLGMVFQPGIDSPASSAISEAQLVTSQRILRCQQVLRDLNTAFYEDYRKPIDSDSQDGLLSLIKLFEPMGTQSIGAESTGRIVATWRIPEGALTLEFVSRQRFKYAITITDSSGNVHRRWGMHHRADFLSVEPLASRFLRVR